MILFLEAGPRTNRKSCVGHRRVFAFRPRKTVRVLRTRRCVLWVPRALALSRSALLLSASVACPLRPPASPSAGSRGGRGGPHSHPEPGQEVKTRHAVGRSHELTPRCVEGITWVLSVLLRSPETFPHNECKACAPQQHPREGIELYALPSAVRALPVQDARFALSLSLRDGRTSGGWCREARPIRRARVRRFGDSAQANPHL